MWEFPKGAETEGKQVENCLLSVLFVSERCFSSLLIGAKKSVCFSPLVRHIGSWIWNIEYNISIYHYWVASGIYSKNIVAQEKGWLHQIHLLHWTLIASDLDWLQNIGRNQVVILLQQSNTRHPQVERRMKDKLVWHCAQVLGPTFKSCRWNWQKNVLQIHNRKQMKTVKIIYWSKK